MQLTYKIDSHKSFDAVDCGEVVMTVMTGSRGAYYSFIDVGRNCDSHSMRSGIDDIGAI